MSVAFDIFWLTVSFAIPTAVELSVTIGVGSFWYHPISFIAIYSILDPLSLVNRYPKFTSAADEKVCLRIPEIASSTLLCMTGFLIRSSFPPKMSTHRDPNLW